MVAAQLKKMAYINKQLMPLLNILGLSFRVLSPTQPMTL